MRLLAIDTALATCAAAVFDTDGGKILASESQMMSRGHAEALMPLVARVMDKADVEFANLDRVAVTVGPGSFTGVRVGISAARGIALAAGKPAVGIPTLVAFAAPQVANPDGADIVAAIDARHGHVYLQIFASNGHTLMGPLAASLESALQAATLAPARLVGSGARLMASEWPSDEHAPLLIDAQEAPAI